MRADYQSTLLIASLASLVMAIIFFVMEREMLLGIKQRAERSMHDDKRQEGIQAAVGGARVWGPFPSLRTRAHTSSHRIGACSRARLCDCAGDSHARRPTAAHPIWRNLGGDDVLANTTRGFRKEKNMRTTPRITLLAYDPRRPLRHIEIRGPVTEMIEEGRWYTLTN